MFLLTEGYRISISNTMKDNGSLLLQLGKHSIAFEVLCHWFTFVCTFISKSSARKIRKVIFDKINHKIKLRTKVKNTKDNSNHM